MNQKQGFTLTMLTVTVIIMFIIISATSIVGVKTISSANYEEYLSKLSRVKDAVDVYKIKNKSLPLLQTDEYAVETVAIDTLSNQMKAELVKKR